MPLVLHSVVNRQLTLAEGDGNFTYLDGKATDALNQLAAMHGGIADFESAGPFFYVLFADHTRMGPYDLPSPDFNVLRADWAPATSYLQNDIVGNRGRSYLVGINHTSDATFDADRVIGSTQVYRLLPTARFSDAVDIDTPTYLLSENDVGCYLRCTHPHGCVVFVPPGIYEKNDETTFRQTLDNAPITFVALSPAIINGVAGYHDITSKRGATAALKCVSLDGNSFDLIAGMLEPGSGSGSP